MTSSDLGAQTAVIECANWALHHELLRDIRARVFIEEQSVPKDIEWDGRDEGAEHFLIWVGDEAVGCGRRLPDGKVGRMAVLPSWRGRGLGQLLLAAIVEQAVAAGLPELHLHAQLHAAGFYRQAGFHEHGEAFYEAGIPHIAMSMTLK